MKRSGCTVLYDKEQDRLVYFGADADESLWDSQWAALLKPEAIKRPDPFVVQQTRGVLAPGARVLDAGCGLSHTVWGLRAAGFEAYGVDYAKQTVEVVNRLAPELDVRVADVRKLPFPDAYFDGIWSLGVIEHFYDGFDEIIDEMWRATKPGGYAFVTVPAMSPLRSLKARLNLYPNHAGDRDDFYQFVLPKAAVVAAFEARGWDFAGGSVRGGFKGLKDESGPLYPLLQRIYDLESKPARLARAAANRLLSPVSHHTRFYLFQKGIEQAPGSPPASS